MSTRKIEVREWVCDGRVNENGSPPDEPGPAISVGTYRCGHRLLHEPTMAEPRPPGWIVLDLGPKYEGGTAIENVYTFESRLHLATWLRWMVNATEDRVDQRLGRLLSIEPL